MDKNSFNYEDSSMKNITSSNQMKCSINILWLYSKDCVRSRDFAPPPPPPPPPYPHIIYSAVHAQFAQLE